MTFWLVIYICWARNILCEVNFEQLHMVRSKGNSQAPPPPSDTPYLWRKITGENATVSFSGHFRSSFIQDYIFFSRQIFGVVRNTGRRVIFSVDRSSPPVRIYGGPLSYRYLLHEIEIKFGGDDSHGSEHTVNGKAFPLEVRSQFARTYEAALLEHLK